MMLSLYTTKTIRITPVPFSRKSKQFHSPNATIVDKKILIPQGKDKPLRAKCQARLITTMLNSPPQMRTHTRPAGQDEFGSSLSSSSDTLVVGGVGYNSSAGAAYIFTVSRSGVYQADQRIVHPEQVNRGCITPSYPTRGQEHPEIVQLRRPFATRSSQPLCV